MIDALFTLLGLGVGGLVGRVSGIKYMTKNLGAILGETIRILERKGYFK